MGKMFKHVFWGLMNIVFVLTIAIAFQRAYAADPVFIDINLNGTLDEGESFFNIIQDAINAASPGDTIHVTSGMHDVSGQILISKNLNIVGNAADKPVIRPTASRTGGNAADAWWLVTSGVTFHLHNVILDGSTFFVRQAIRSHGSITIDNVDFRNIQGSLSGSPYSGIAVESFGGTISGGSGFDTHGSGGAPSTLVVTDSTFEQIGRVGVLIKGTESTATLTNNTYTGKGDGNFLDYAFEAGAGGSMTATGNNISGNRGIASDASTSAGILVTDFFGTGTNASINGNTFSGNSAGIYVGYNASDASVVTAHENDFSGQTVAIISTAPAVNAENNWWGTTDSTEISAKISGILTTFDPWYMNSGKTALSNIATLHVIKLVVNASDGTAVPSDFNVHVRNGTLDVAGSPTIGTSVPGTYYSLPAGTYVVSEDINPAYTQSFSGDCNLNGTITLALGDDKICTIINTDIPLPPPLVTSSSGGSLIVLPFINITKIPSPLALPSGPGSITYTYTTTNIGEVPMSEVWVKDDECSPITFVSGDSNNNQMLESTETWVYSCIKTVSQTVTNTATAHGSANGWDGYDTALATVIVGPAFPDTGLLPPLINIIKVPSRLTPFLFGGGDIMYTYTVTNPGAVSLHDVSVTDDRCGPVSGPLIESDANSNDLLDVGETWFYTCRTNISVSTKNIATATGKANNLTALDHTFTDVLVLAPGLPDTGEINKTTDIGTDNISKEWAIIAFQRSLRSGVKGSDVALLQTALEQTGIYPLVVDGLFGPLTRTAVSKYQANNDLISDGIFGPLTRAKFISELK